jgi:hypothetical protein
VLLAAVNDRTNITLGEFEKPSDGMVFYGNVFDTAVYVPRFEFEFEDEDKNMDQWTSGGSLNMV